MIDTPSYSTHDISSFRPSVRMHVANIGSAGFCLGIGSRVLEAVGIATDRDCPASCLLDKAEAATM